MRIIDKLRRTERVSLEDAAKTQGWSEDMYHHQSIRLIHAECEEDEDDDY